MSSLKYRVQIPPPTAKRMDGNCTVVMTYEDGWSGAVEQTLNIPAGQTTFEFFVDEDVEWKRTSVIMDGPTFDIRAVYRNKNGSREEVKWLVPQRIS